MTSLNIDNHKLMYHKERVKEWLLKGDCFPVYLEIGLTNRCHHNCVFCGLDFAKGTDTLNTSVLDRNLKDMQSHGVKAVCYSGAGEPLLHEDFKYLIKATKKSGLDVAFSTTGVLYDKDTAEQTLPYLSWIRFSVDAATQETHSKIHRAPAPHFAKIIKNLENAAKIKREGGYDTVLGVQFLLLDENAEEVVQAGKLFKGLGVDNLQVKPYSQNPHSINRLSVDYKRFEDLGRELEKMSDDNFKVMFRSERMKRVSSNQEYDECRGLPFIAIINEKGEVVPCHNFYTGPSYGNINEKIFSEIWLSRERQEVIDRIKEEGISSCKKGCRMDCINKFLDDLVSKRISLDDFQTEQVPEHVNFI